jgi:hypothetical protein
MRFKKNGDRILALNSLKVRSQYKRKCDRNIKKVRSQYKENQKIFLAISSDDN